MDGVNASRNEQASSCTKWLGTTQLGPQSSGAEGPHGRLSCSAASKQLQLAFGLHGRPIGNVFEEPSEGLRRNCCRAVRCVAGGWAGRAAASDCRIRGQPRAQRLGRMLSVTQSSRKSWAAFLRVHGGIPSAVHSPSQQQSKKTGRRLSRRMEPNTNL